MHEVEKCAVETFLWLLCFLRNFQPLILLYYAIILIKTLTACTVSLICTSTSVTASIGLAILPSCCLQGITLMDTYICRVMFISFDGSSLCWYQPFWMMNVLWPIPIASLVTRQQAIRVDILTCFTNLKYCYWIVKSVVQRRWWEEGTVAGWWGEEVSGL